MAKSHKYKFRRAILILIFFVALAALHLLINTQNIDLKYQLTDLKLKLRKIQSKNRLLAIQIAKKENLKNIEKIAKEKLNMTYPSKVNYIVSSGEPTAVNNPKKKNQ